MTLLQEAEDLCRRHKENFWAAVHVHAAMGGVVYITPECILIAELQPPMALVWLASGTGYLHKLCVLAPPSITQLAWRRVDDPRPRQFPISRVKRLLQAAHEKTKGRTHTSSTGSAASHVNGRGSGNSPARNSSLSA